MTAPALPLVQLTPDERDLVGRLSTAIRRQRRHLELSDAFYDAEQVIEDLGISIPAELSDLHTVAGWGAAGVDALEERLDVEGFRLPGASGGDSRLWDRWQANRLDIESSLAHVDAFVHSHSFVSLGSGEGGPNEVDAPTRIVVETAHQLAAEYDARDHEITAALRLYRVDGVELATLYGPFETVFLVMGRRGWDVVDRDLHNLGRVPLVRFANRQRTARRHGRSEITTACRSLIQSCSRTLLGLEVSREFYAAPRRYVLGASEDAFEKPDGTTVSAWEAYAGRVWGLTRDEDGQMPEVGTFAAYDPTAFTRIIEQYARLYSSETGLPAGYLGIATDQPASADAIRMAEQRLVKRAERRQKVLGEAWEDVMRLALLIEDGVVPDDAHRMETLWRNPATPTQASLWDATVKGVQAGILPPDSSVTYDMAGLSVGQQERLTIDRRRAETRAALAAIAGRAQGATAAPGAPAAGAGAANAATGGPGDPASASGAVAGS